MNVDQDNSRRRNSSGAVLDSTMSLVGRLEDLSLGEILQIVSLSKRSGLLRLESLEDKANLYIRAGKVIYAARSDEKEGVLSLLVHHGLVKLDQLEAMRGELEGSTSAEQLRGLLDGKLGITLDAFQQVLKKRVEELVYSLFHWEEGTFSFQLIEEEKDHPLLARMAPFFLDDGIGAQFLVMEGARRKDELRRESSTGPAMPGGEPSATGLEVNGDWQREFEQQLSRETAAPGKEDGLIQELEEFEIPATLPPLPGNLAGTVVLIGLSRTLAAGVANALKGKGITLLVHENGADGLTRIQELRQNRINPFTILDVEAAGITDDREMGGLEILSTMWDLGFSLPVGLVHRRDLPSELSEKLDRIPGVHVFPVPGPPHEEEIAGKILNMVENTLADMIAARPSVAEGVSYTEPPGKAEERPETASPEPGQALDSRSPEQGPVPLDTQEFYDIQRELSDELEGIDLPFEGWEGEELPREKPLDPHMSQLSSYVNELNRQDISGEITLLALRFAASFVSRGVLFLVRKGDLKGLGQFGVDLGEGKDADSAIRSLTLPLKETGIFARVIVTHQSYKGPPTGSEEEKNLFEILGGKSPGEIFLGPIISMGKVAVLLYGDDHPGKSGIEPTHTLDIFLSHVGLALDRAFLEMKLKTQRS